MINFDLIFGNSYHSEPPGEEMTRENTVPEKQLPCEKNSCCSTTARKKELPYTIV
ncbi:MAG: hypothetical protein ACK2T7_05265 [Anaerolineales bacterium]